MQPTPEPVQMAQAPVAPRPGNWLSPVMQPIPGVMEGYALANRIQMENIGSLPYYPANDSIYKENVFHLYSADMISSPEDGYDPNHFWSPSESINPVNPSVDPGQDYIDLAGTVNNAAKIDTGWENEDQSTQDQAIMNAFRVAILSPRKHIKWNAAHYQALMNTDPSTRAVHLWDILEREREKHNQALGYPEGSHLAYRKQLDFLAHEIQTQEPDLSLAEALRRAKNITFSQIKKFEKQLQMQTPGKSELWYYNQARKLLTQWMVENYTPPRGWQPGQMALAALGDGQKCLNCGKDASEDRRLQVGGVYCQDCLEDNPNLRLPQEPLTHKHGDTEDWQPEQQITDATGFGSNEAKYGAFMGAHLDALSEIGQHIEPIRQAALKDIEEDSGRGYIFRNAIMKMNIRGVNPKVASFAWLLLRPLTSELGIIDTHVARGLRRDPNAISLKDYYKYERMQRAAKDATGYSHVPLGLYHWGLWDAIRNPGQHSDHSALRVLDPLPWQDAQWDAATSQKTEPMGTWVGPPAFEQGRPAMEQAARDFDQEFSGSPATKVPMMTAMVRP